MRTEDCSIVIKIKKIEKRYTTKLVKKSVCIYILFRKKFCMFVCINFFYEKIFLETT